MIRESWLSAQAEKRTNHQMRKSQFCPKVCCLRSNLKYSIERWFFNLKAFFKFKFFRLIPHITPHSIHLSRSARIVNKIVGATYQLYFSWFQLVSIDFSWLQLVGGTCQLYFKSQSATTDFLFLQFLVTAKPSHC